ncbi:MAG: hypothetical protein D6795_16835 [Deltaproteobacteria bacterium]|nr:MAG: hypothetical protein D6795_16835 [Deltaproteobacteria bacterium]
MPLQSELDAKPTPSPPPGGEGGGFRSISPEFREGVALLLLSVGVWLCARGILVPRLIVAHDALEYLPRQVEFHENISAGILLPRWAPDLGNGHGYPFFLYNPPFFYYVAEGFHLAGLPFVASIHAAAAFLLLLSAASMYAWARAHWGCFGGMISAIAYLFAPYFLVVLYVRASFSDFAVFFWLPITFLCVERSLRPKGRRAWIVGLALSTAGVILSSNPVALFFLPVLALYPFAYGWRRAFPWPPLSGIVLGVALAGWFWIPALFGKSLIHIDRLLVGYLHYGNHFVHPAQFLRGMWGYGLSLPGVEDGFSFEVGWPQLGAVAFWSLVRLRRRWPPSVGYALFVVAFGLFFASTLSRPIWDRLPLLQYVEFPWRTLTLVVFAAAFLTGGCVTRLPAGAPRFLGGGGLLLLLLLIGVPRARPQGYHSVVEANYRPAEIARRGIAVTTRREYEPRRVKVLAPPSPALLAVERGGVSRLRSERASPERIVAWVESRSEATLRLALHGFPGWRIVLDGKPLSWRYIPPYGLMRFEVPPGVHQVTIRFGNTPLRAIASLLSLLALLGLVALLALEISPHLRERPPRPEMAGERSIER